MTTPANKLQNETLKLLAEQNIFCWRQNNMPVYDPNLSGGYGGYRSHNGIKGIPDIIAIVRGQFIGIEIKAGKDRMSPDQVLFKKRCERNGGRYFVVKTIEDVHTIIAML